MERLLIWFGLSLAGLGLVLAGLGLLLHRVGDRGGRLLPGDIVVSRPGFTLVLPVVTSLVLSLVVTLLVWAARAWRH